MRIVADFGGTNARLAALDEGGQPGPVRAYPGAELAGPAEAVEAFLEDVAGGSIAASERPRSLAMAIAGPTQGEDLALTNLHWSFSRSALRERLGLERLEILNDFEALALAIPRLLESEKAPVREGSPAPSAPIAVLGPGTGLGVASLVPAAAGIAVIAGEGGHRDLAAANEEEWQVVRRLAARFGHVSVERVLSGPGLENLFAVLGEIHGLAPRAADAAEIARLSRSGESIARRATALLSGWLGAVAGDFALTLGARGGVYLAGGVLAGLESAFDLPLFRERFLAKGRMRSYMEPIPVWRVIRPDATLLGCAARLVH